MPIPLTHEQAEKQLLEGACILNSGAYTYISDYEGNHFYYCAYGTYPGCLRGGAKPVFSEKHWTDKSWVRISTIEMIIRNGWYLSDMGSLAASGIAMNDRARGVGAPSFERMMTYALEQGVTPAFLKEPLTSGPFWKEYFIKNGLYPAENDNA